MLLCGHHGNRKVTVGALGRGSNKPADVTRVFVMPKRGADLSGSDCPKTLPDWSDNTLRLQVPTIRASPNREKPPNDAVFVVEFTAHRSRRLRGM